MMHISGKDRNQFKMSCLDEQIEADNVARFIDEFVDSTDTSYFINAEVKTTGRPAYDPKDMLKLYIYGMENGIVSSRKLERECKRNIELKWLLEELAPENSTICSFRRNNKDNLVRFFHEFCIRMVETGYIDGKLMAIDGTKIRANNSKRNNFSARKLERHIKYIDEKIESYMNDSEKADKVEEYRERKATYESKKEKIESGEVTEVSTTDPDARLMSTSNNGVDVSYNVQSVVDAKSKMIAGMSVTNNAADFGQLGEVMVRVKEELGLSDVTVLADKGYYRTEDFHTCEENNITTIVAKNEKTERETYPIEDFIYDEENDVVICPCGAEMFSGKVNANGYKEYKNYRACRSCPQKEYCTKGKRRVIKRHIHKAAAERNDKRLSENQELYKQRQMLAEHPFGTIKRTMGIRQFLTRRLEGVASEVALIFLCYNLKRLRNLMKNDDKNEGKPAALKGLFAFLVIQLFRFVSKPKTKLISAV